jgi:hypothetical protein
MAQRLIIILTGREAEVARELIGKLKDALKDRSGDLERLEAIENIFLGSGTK